MISQKVHSAYLQCSLVWMPHHGASTVRDCNGTDSVLSRQACSNYHLGKAFMP